MEQIENYSLQINVIDTLLWKTDPRFDLQYIKRTNKPIIESPVFRIFGTTEDGLHRCMIVHNYFPEIYVNLPEKEEDFPQFTSELLRYIDKSYGDKLIYETDIIEATSIYGYQEKKKFLMLSLLNPDMQQILMRHLGKFAWNGSALQIFEAHCQSFMKFLAKYNLTGFGYLRIKKGYKTKAEFSCYEFEVHCSVEDIEVMSYNSNSQILSHLNFIWADQKDLRRRMNLETQAPVDTIFRKDLLFTQRPPKITPSQLPPRTQELEELMEFIEGYDPDYKVESLAKEEEMTQMEITSLMEDGAGLYNTPTNFVAGRISQCLQVSMSQMERRKQVQTIGAKLVSEFASVPIDKEIEGDSKEKESDEKKEPAVNVSEGEHASQYIKILFVEIGCSTRGKLLPDPKIDSVYCISCIVQIDSQIIERISFFVGHNVNTTIKTVFVNTEAELFREFIKYVHNLDPDILIGYNIERESLGYLSIRAPSLGFPNLYKELSRTGREVHPLDECRGIDGRILVNLWRVIRHEISLRSYTLAAVSNHFYNEPFPEVKEQQMTAWLNTAPFRFVSFVSKKVESVASICESMNFINNYCEMASIIGTDFCSTYSRGSQFRIESLLMRVSKRMNYLLLSPQRADVAGQRAPMSLPLVMEPLSGFYSDPVMVIDFQSLYPSSMIGYNLDYSSLVGRTENASTGGQIGCIFHRVPPETIQKLLDSGKLINSPNDVLYVTKDVRPGVFPAMLQQILDLRAFIKQTIKKTKDQRIKNVLEARQLGLKMIAACTYGYTAAHFSGRMPCVELSDSIVECSRHILEYCIKHIEDEYPDLAVLYGDTDSLFVKMPPASNKKCFEYAEKICNEITEMFPSPIKIKLEKIYRGCFLVNKKRYCGWMYETPDQLEPTFDIKGLEMKRRDSCPFVARVMTEVIESVFRTKAAIEAEQIFKENVIKAVHGLIPYDEFFFARELRLGSYKGIEPPGAFVARKQMSEDPMREPLYGQRLQYIVVGTAPGARLVDRVVSPEDFIKNNHRVGTRYYIEKQLVPALGRVMETMGVDITKWIQGIPLDMKKLMPYSFSGKNATVIEQFCMSSQCPLCGNLTGPRGPICPRCLTKAGRSESLIELMRRYKKAQNIINRVNAKCAQCLNEIGTSTASTFCSACHLFWERQLADEQVKTLSTYRDSFQETYCKKRIGKPKHF